MINAGILVIGLIILLYGSHLSVRQAMALAQHYHLSDLVIGVVLLAMGSDLPEIAISIDAALHQDPYTNTSGLIFGNVLGSDFSQIGLIMGLTGLFGYLTLKRREIILYGGVLLGSIILLALAALDGQISQWEGGLLVLAFIIYAVMLFGGDSEVEGGAATVNESLWKTWSLLLLGLVLVIVGAEVTTEAALGLADYFGLSQSFVAITLIGIGSSLPELAISLAAVQKARGGLSVGNLIGSNIIDTLLPVGIASAIHPMTIDVRLVHFDLSMLFVLTLVVLFFFTRVRGLQKAEARILIGLYGGYLLLKLFDF